MFASFERMFLLWRAGDQQLNIQPGRFAAFLAGMRIASQVSENGIMVIVALGNMPGSQTNSSISIGCQLLLKQLGWYGHSNGVAAGCLLRRYLAGCQAFSLVVGAAVYVGGKILRYTALAYATLLGNGMVALIRE